MTAERVMQQNSNGSPETNALLDRASKAIDETRVLIEEGRRLSARLSYKLAKERATRCYFFRRSKIEFVEVLVPGSDEELIKQASELFGKQKGLDFNRIEVWDGRRLVYRIDPRRPENHDTNRWVGPSAV